VPWGLAAVGPFRRPFVKAGVSLKSQEIHFWVCLLTTGLFATIVFGPIMPELAFLVDMAFLCSVSAGLLTTGRLEAFLCGPGFWGSGRRASLIQSFHLLFNKSFEFLCDDVFRNAVRVKNFTSLFGIPFFLSR